LIVVVVVVLRSLVLVLLVRQALTVVQVQQILVQVVTVDLAPLIKLVVLVVKVSSFCATQIRLHLQQLLRLEQLRPQAGIESTHSTTAERLGGRDNGFIC
jgi:hypothetical protein